MKEINPLSSTTNLLRQRLIDENRAMLKYLASEGKSIPQLAEKILGCKEENEVQHILTNSELLLLHQQLSKKIIPAKPKTLLLLYKESKNEKWHYFLGPVSLVRRFMSATLFCLVLFIGISLSPDVNNESLTEGIMNNSGTSLFLNLTFILTAAALGGCFSGLFQVNKYVNEGTYDPKYESSYWIRLLLGIISGLMLAVIIPTATNIDLGEGKGMHLTITLLAMLGGFSASLLYRILIRIVWAVEFLFIGKQEDKQDQKLLNLQTVHEQEKNTTQQILFQNLAKIKTKIVSGDSAEDIEKMVDKLMNEIIRDD